MHPRLADLVLGDSFLQHPLEGIHGLLHVGSLIEPAFVLAKLFFQLVDDLVKRLFLLLSERGFLHLLAQIGRLSRGEKPNGILALDAGDVGIIPAEFPHGARPLGKAGLIDARGDLLFGGQQANERQKKCEERDAAEQAGEYRRMRCAESEMKDMPHGNRAAYSLQRVRHAAFIGIPRGERQRHRVRGALAQADLRPDLAGAARR